MQLIYDFFDILKKKEDDDEKIETVKCDTVTYDDTGNPVCYFTKKGQKENEKSREHKSLKTGALA